MKEADLSVLGAENQFDLNGRQWMLITAGIDLPESQALIKEIKRLNKGDFQELPDYNGFYVTVQDNI